MRSKRSFNIVFLMCVSYAGVVFDALVVPCTGFFRLQIQPLIPLLLCFNLAPWLSILYYCLMLKCIENIEENISCVGEMVPGERCQVLH